MSKELVRDGKLDREAAAEALREFLTRIIHAGKFELSVKVRTAESAGGSEEGEAEVFADLDGKDKEILIARGGEVLKGPGAPGVSRAWPGTRVPRKDSPGLRRVSRTAFEELRMTARVAAERVLASRQPFQLNAMSSRERRIVHLALKDMPGVRTESSGTGEERHIVIHPAK